MSNNTLKERLKRLDMTQKDLADALGVNPVSVSRWDMPPTYAIAYIVLMENRNAMRDELQKLVDAWEEK